MNFLRGFLLTAIFASLTACGGGGSSSGGGGSVTYIGTQSITLSTRGISETAPPVRFVMTISGNTVTIRDADFTATGKLNGNQFSVTSPSFSFTEDGVTCRDTVITYNGSRNGNQVSGKLNGGLRCNGLAFSARGSFTAKSNTAAKQLIPTVRNALADLIH